MLSPRLPRRLTLAAWSATTLRCSTRPPPNVPANSPKTTTLPRASWRVGGGGCRGTGTASIRQRQNGAGASGACRRNAERRSRRPPTRLQKKMNSVSNWSTAPLRTGSSATSTPLRLPARSKVRRRRLLYTALRLYARRERATRLRRPGLPGLSGAGQSLRGARDSLGLAAVPPARALVRCATGA